MDRAERSGRLALCRVIAFAGMMLASGCGGPAYKYDAVVTGTVTVDDELAKTGTITFQPVKKGQAAIGRINPDGSYSLRTGQGDLAHADGGTVASGEYLVTATITGPAAAGEVVSEGGPPKPGPSLIDKKYASKETTDVRQTVKPGKQVIVLEFKGAEPEAATENVPADTKAAAEEKTNDKAKQAEPADTKEKSAPPAKPETANPATQNPTAGPEK